MLPELRRVQNARVLHFSLHTRGKKGCFFFAMRSFFPSCGSKKIFWSFRAIVSFSVWGFIFLLMKKKCVDGKKNEKERRDRKSEYMRGRTTAAKQWRLRCACYILIFMDFNVEMKPVCRRDVLEGVFFSSLPSLTRDTSASTLWVLFIAIIKFGLLKPNPDVFSHRCTVSVAAVSGHVLTRALDVNVLYFLLKKGRKKIIRKNRRAWRSCTFLF